MTKTVAAERDAAGELLALSRRLDAYPGFPEAVESLRAGHGATLDGVWGSSSALAAAALVRHAPGPLVVVLPHAGDVDELGDDLRLFTEARQGRFPAWNAEDAGAVARDEDWAERLRLLKALAENNAPQLLLTTIQALLQPVVSQAGLLVGSRRLSVGQEIVPDELLQWLVEQGFEGTPAVQLPGEFSSRGGILDIFPLDSYDPVRIELFGEEITSIRRFEVETQRSLAPLESLDLTTLPTQTTDRCHLADHLPANAWFLLLEPAALEEEAKHFRQRSERPQDLHPLDDVWRSVYRFPSVLAAGVAAGSMETTCRLPIESVERFSGDIHKVRDELDAAGIGQDVYIVCQNEAEQQRLGEVFAATRLATEGRLHYPLGRLRSGFRLVPDRVVLVGSGELFHRADVARGGRRRLGKAIDSFLDLREGDLVVHLSHGIGRYRGMSLLEKGQQVEEHLELEFHGGTKVFVPASKIDLVQKYVGGTKSRPTLARLGSQTWVRQKQAAQQAVTDLASEMLELQASRAMRPGYAFPVDTDWQREFDASFPYRETRDQLSSIEAIKQDMQTHRPMDRLLCGDVGFGKTEVAMRAAFKAIDAGFQVAVLVPTTILAEQHRRTFTQRMAEFPFSVAALSRFCTTREEKKILESLSTGGLDVVIGTHRLAQFDVKFQNLGLLIIDEEQRFGVEVKERLKALRQTVDVLTMTATPIPRTLHLSLLGIRDISNLETPPEDRVPVETRVCRFDRELVRHAVLRELNRGGQIYFVHNRVQDIELVAKLLGQVVPEARLGIAHGQMPEGELEARMVGFVDRKFDILLSTTIIESGLDIPNANTIFINEADRYGLADLHQLRGRVGRFKHRAYCYLLIDPGRHLSETSAKRLRAIEEFKDMGAGFAIAMRDLEIRGAGNILGTQQSGHISAVGYELYCELLEQAVRGLKHLPPRASVDVSVDLPGEAYLPRSYVADMRQKIDLYRRFTRVATLEELADCRAELVDRFGPAPAPVERLLALAELRVLAHGWAVESIHQEDDYLVFRYTSPERIKRLAKASQGRLRIADGRSAYLPTGGRLTDADKILAAARSLLRLT